MTEKKNIIQKIAKRSAILRIISGIACIILGIILLVVNSDYTFAVFKKTPKLTEISQIQELYDSGQIYVELFAAELYDLEYDILTRYLEDGKEKSSKLTSSFLFIEMDEPEDYVWFLIEVPYEYIVDENSTFENETFKGFLSKPRNSAVKGAEEEAVKVFAEVFEITEAEAKDYISVIYLDVAGVKTESFVAVYAGVALIVLGILLFIYAILLLANYKMSRIYKSLWKFGEPEDIEQQIIDEMNDVENGLIVDLKNSCITKTYVIAKKIYLTKDLVWVYSHRYTYNGVTSYFAELRFTDGKKTNMTAKNDNELNETITKIAYSVPVLVGYEKERVKLFKKDRDEILRLRDQQVKEREEYRLEQLKQQREQSERKNYETDEE